MFDLHTDFSKWQAFSCQLKVHTEKEVNTTTITVGNMKEENLQHTK